jgi:hypothetical protein
VGRWVAIAGLVFGAGCLRANPAYDGDEGASEGAGGPGGVTTGDGGTQAGSVTTEAGSGGAGESSGGTTGATTAAIGESTGGSTGEASTGEASTGGTDGFCDPGLQGANGCSALGQTGLLLCETVTTWDAAKLACEQLCGRLAIVREPERVAVFTELEARMTEQDALDEQAIEGGMGSAVTNPRAAVWIGAQAAAADAPYTWVDGSPMPAAKDMFGWGPNDPDFSGLCAALGVFGKGADDGEYFDRQCELEPYRFLCDPG